jgi:uncharacterized protein
MRILILHDGRAGHMSQSRGIVAAFRRSFEVEETWYFCKLRAGLFQRPLRAVLPAYAHMLRDEWFWISHRSDGVPGHAPDLIVSAGGGTMYANAWLAARLGCPNLFCGELRGLRPSLFRGVITAYEKHGQQPPFLLSPTPVPVEREALPPLAEALRRRLSLGDAPYWSMLIGGKGSGYRYGQQDWQRLVAAMRVLSQQHGIRWLVTTSRRTGAHAEEFLAELLRGRPEIAASSYALRGGEGISVREILATATRHFCTEDSHMMISEAIATGRPVHSLQPAHFQTTAPNQHFLDLYVGRLWLQRMPIYGMEHAPFPAEDPPPPPRATVLDELAPQLAAWWDGCQEAAR